MLKLDINLLWTVVNVLIMYALLRKFLFKPVQDVLDKRQKMVDSVRPTPSWPRARQLQKQSAPASCARPTHRSPT